MTFFQGNIEIFFLGGIWAALLVSVWTRR